MALLVESRGERNHASAIFSTIRSVHAFLKFRTKRAYFKGQALPERPYSYNDTITKTLHRSSVSQCHANNASSEPSSEAVSIP